MDDETESGRLTHQLGRLHAWKGGIAGQPYLEIVSLTIANMCQGDRGEVSSDSPTRLPIVEEHPVWHAVLDELAQVMTAENFNAWLATTRVVHQEGEVLRVAVPVAFNKTWLDTKLAGRVVGALQKIDYDALVARRVAHVEYVVEAAA